MQTLNQVLCETSHSSVLVRKAKRLGVSCIEQLISLAVERGCSHYKNVVHAREIVDLNEQELTNEELVVLLLHGNYAYEPMAMRCAAQLLKKRGLSARRVAFLAVMERCSRALYYIADLGSKHDKGGERFWLSILNHLTPPKRKPRVGVFPHVSRFMVNPGFQRGGMRPAVWLAPTS